MTEPGDPAQAWLDRAAQAIESGDLSGGARIAAEAVAQHPDVAALWNLCGAVSAGLGRIGEGITALERASCLDPRDPEPLRNLFSLHFGQGDWAEASRAGFRLLELRPRDAETHQLIGLAAAGAGKRGAAEARLRVAATFGPQRIDTWLDLIALLRLTDADKAGLAAEAALAANPRDPRILAARRDLVAAAVLDQALTADPANPELLVRWLAMVSQRQGEGEASGWSPVYSEGLELQKAHDAVFAALDAGLSPRALPPVAAPMLARLLAWYPLEAVWMSEQQEGLADPRNLMMRLSRTLATRDDRLALLDHHRRWGERAEAAAACAPVAPAPHAKGGKIRLGFVTSDLRTHPVGAFAWPLFDHLDRERFELYVYSVRPAEADPLQSAFTERSTAYRILAGADPKRFAELIAADVLDVLLDLGGLTGANRPEVMAYRLAPIQVSWLGYPHSMGLSTIDYVLVDPYLAPPDLALLIEKPLAMPRSWIAMGDSFFREEPRPAAAPPQARNGFTTFGTANATYKYSSACIKAWGRVLAATPGSRFLIVRPEADAPSFRARILEGFAAQGVSPERIAFEAVRGRHLPFYDRMDVSLDTLPLTGGTTTCESLWMGVPVVSLVGEALYERLSYSILNNVGLGDLAVGSVDDYVATAAALAADGERLARLKTGLREQIKAGPLGDTAGFARDFYDLIARTVADRAG